MGTCSSVRPVAAEASKAACGKRGATGGVEGAAPSCRGRISRGGFGRGCGLVWGQESRQGWGRGQRQGRGQGALASPDRVVLRDYRLRAVLGLGGGGKARESPASMGNLRLRGLLGAAPGPGPALRREWQSGRSQASRAPSAPPPGRCSPAGGRGASPRLEAAARALAAGRTLRSRRSRAGVCGRPRRRGDGLHCDPGRGARPHRAVPPAGNPAARALSAVASRELEGSGHGSAPDPLLPDGGVHGTEPGIRAERRHRSNPYRQGYDPLPGAGAGHGGDLTHAGFARW